MQMYNTRKDAGGVLILVTLSMVAAGVLGGAMLTGVTGARTQRVHFDAGGRALYAAESGRAYVTAQFGEDPSYVPDGTYTLASGDRFTAIGSVAGNVMDVTVTGMGHPGTHRERIHALSFQLPLPSGDNGDDNGDDNGGGSGSIDLDTIFVSSSELLFRGNTLAGEGGSLILRGDLDSSDIGGGSSLAVSTMYIDGDVRFTGGSASLGSATEPGAIYINGDLTLGGGQRDIYGDVFVNGNLTIANTTVHGNIYVNGDVTFQWGTPTLMPGSSIYYTGSVSAPGSYSQEVLDRAVQVDSVPAVEIPGDFVPVLRPDSWYAERGYVSGGQLASDLKVFADNYTWSGWRPPMENVVIVSKGDISITGLGGSGMTGGLIAPFGEVVFQGAYFTGMVLARDGFRVTSGETTVTFENISSFFPSESEIPVTSGD